MIYSFIKNEIMQIFRLLLLIQFSFLFTLQAFSSSITHIDIKPLNQEKVFLLTFNAQGKGKINIKLYDDRSNILFAENIKAAKVITKRFDLRQLKSGNYTLQVMDGISTTQQKMIVTSKEVFIDKKGQTIFHTPHWKFDKRKKLLDLTWLNSQQVVAATKISDMADIQLVNDIIDSRIKVHKRYDLSSLPKGRYFVEFKFGEQSFRKVIDL